MAYWAEKQRQAKYDFDEEALRPYFELDRVLAGLFEIVNRVFGITVRETRAPGWHPEVRYYDILDEGERTSLPSTPTGSRATPSAAAPG